ncbi:dTMP kinase [Henriciella barbarensis]|uniref:Thymidylate kinase n=1 Tax=Henriciella barbarensis TaxID=86342 RepID=A0A399QR35_9PROT|nr:dTMP kinase [Henriciella barbarensis]RIJ20645.1 dTMP kinase [Henriciella barbarensis]
MSRRGRFITIEGGEGTGKSTLIAGLENHFLDHGQRVTVTREPGGTPLAEALRGLVLSPPSDERWSAMSEALLVYAARRDHLEKLIEPALAEGQNVICDRFADSTRVYQRLGGLAPAIIEMLDDLVVADHQPDLTLVLDGPVEDLMARRKARGGSDVFEAMPLEFHKDVRQGFLDLAATHPDRCTIIDATQPPGIVLADALNAIEDMI